MNIKAFHGANKSRFVVALAFLMLGVAAQAQRINFKVSIIQNYEEVQTNGKTVKKTEPVLTNLEIFMLGVKHNQSPVSVQLTTSFILVKAVIPSIIQLMARKFLI